MSTQSAVPIRVLLVDDQPLFRRAIATLIEEQPDMTVVGEAANGLDGVEQAHALDPDVVVMDVEMPVMDGVQAVALLQEQAPRAKVVMLTVSDSEDSLFDALRNGADGYLLKDLRPDQLYDMLRAVMRDESPISPAIASRLLDQLRGHDAVKLAPTDHPDGPGLTRREIEILQLVADGLSNKEIGTELTITEGTVKNHVHNALEKLHLENRIQAAAYVVRHGLGHRPNDAT